MDTLITMLIGALASALLFGLLWLKLRGRKKGASAETQILSTIDQMRAIGQLSVFKVITKEIVTETDHSWGDIGKRYLSWVLSNKKMAMIFEFEIDFRYDLKNPAFQIEESAPGEFTVTMPPCDYEAHIRDIKFYDEQGSKLLPWLLPDLLNGFLGDGFSEEDKNRLVNAARAHAEKQAQELISSLQSEVRSSAQSTLQSISRAFGAGEVAFEFPADEKPDIHVEMSETAAA